jgi:HD-GYP domain-containing protein (c-di-GMP phosphodiesterase class II)
LSIEEAAAELRACCGSQFDGRIVEAFVKAMDISLEENNPIQEEMQLEIASEDPA